jgi:hypothetical protein
MSSPTKKTGETDRRTAERRTVRAERRSEVTRAVAGERREVDQRGVATAMVDALEDILKWERASERVLKVAAKTSASDLTKN